jgi:hypothetical protein
MTNIRKLLNQIATQETELRSTQFLAPCVRQGKIRTRVAGIIYTFNAKPAKFEGWGIFQAIDEFSANLVEEADLYQIDSYLEKFRSFRLRLAYPLQGKTWLAYPVSEADFRQRLGTVKPYPVHLVSEGSAFEQIIARWDGKCCWFAELDRHADPAIAEKLKTSLRKLLPPETLHFQGITSEMRSVYELAARQNKEFCEQYSDENRLKKALRTGGGQLQQYQDRGDYWTVEWTTATGEHHTSAIAKNDLTVISSGICLSGRDRDFDLQSLVGVIENQD